MNQVEEGIMRQFKLYRRSTAVAVVIALVTASA